MQTLDVSDEQPKLLQDAAVAWSDTNDEALQNWKADRNDGMSPEEHMSNVGWQCDLDIDEADPSITYDSNAFTEAFDTHRRAVKSCVQAFEQYVHVFLWDWNDTKMNFIDGLSPSRHLVGTIVWSDYR